jgi:imidazolonepropionase-like amidohydrolase
MKRLLSLFLVVLLAAPALADTRPPARQGTFAITNATIVTVSHGTIQNGTLVIEGDRIVAVGQNVQVPAGAEVIDGSGKYVYPGMIDAGTRVGLVEIGSLPETRDFTEVGTITPQMRAITAINPNSASIPVTRVSGVTTVISEPTGGLFPGTAAAINLHGYTPAQMHVDGAEFAMMEFPFSGRRGGFDRRSAEDIAREHREAMENLNEVWERALLFAEIESAYAAEPVDDRTPRYVPEMEALLPVVRGERTLIVRVERAQDIINAIDWLTEQGIDNAILSGVIEGWRVADRIAQSGYPVIVGPVLSVPTRPADRYDKPYSNAGMLHREGVTVALRTGSAENVRNLPFHAGFAAAYGMDSHAAIRAVTLTPAQILGIDHEVGSLDEGKSATLFISDGDPFEPRTTIEQVFINGWMIPMESRQTRLYDEFINRTPGAQ